MKLPSGFLCATLAVAIQAPAATLHVGRGGKNIPPYATRETAATSVQAAIDAAADGDRILIGIGRFAGNVDFRAKRIVVRGRGPATVLAGTGAGTVVRIAGGQGRESALDSVQVTGGRAGDGGGILISNASPRVQRTLVFANLASGSGAGIYVTGRSAQPFLSNNVLAYNDDATPGATDAHQIFVETGSSAVILNNTIVRGNGNGILTQTSGRPSVVRNNIIVWNGSILRNGRRIGRGICDFSGSARIHHNLFYRNTRAAVLTGAFDDFRLVANGEASVGESRFTRNADGDPRFRDFLPDRTPGSFDAAGLQLRGTSPAVDAGSPQRRFRDRDGSRNDLGHTGGPLGWR